MTKLQGLLFVALLAIFAIQVQAQDGYNHYEEFEKDFPDSCEELFKVKECNKCQKFMWERFKKPGDCATVINVGIEVYKAIKDSGETPVPYDLKFFKKGLTNYCHKDFHCPQEEAESIYNEVQEVCAKELTVKFDWSAHPKTYTDKTAYAAYGTLLAYYTGIPAREALCLEGKHEDFCSYEFASRFVAWMKKVTDADPKAIVSHDYKFVIKDDGTKIPVPSYFGCDPCWRKMAKVYIAYFNEHKLKDSVAENIWGHNHDHELPHCYYQRGIARAFKRQSDANLNKRSPIPPAGFGSLHPLSGLL